MNSILETLKKLCTIAARSLPLTDSDTDLARKSSSSSSNNSDSGKKLVPVVEDVESTLRRIASPIPFNNFVNEVRLNWLLSSGRERMSLRDSFKLRKAAQRRWSQFSERRKDKYRWLANNWRHTRLPLSIISKPKNEVVAYEAKKSSSEPLALMPMPMSQRSLQPWRKRSRPILQDSHMLLKRPRLSAPVLLSRASRAPRAASLLDVFKAKSLASLARAIRGPAAPRASRMLPTRKRVATTRRIPNLRKVKGFPRGKKRVIFKPRAKNRKVVRRRQPPITTNSKLKSLKAKMAERIRRAIRPQRATAKKASTIQRAKRGQQTARVQRSSQAQRASRAKNTRPTKVAHLQIRAPAAAARTQRMRAGQNKLKRVANAPQRIRLVAKAKKKAPQAPQTLKAAEVLPPPPPVQAPSESLLLPVKTRGLKRLRPNQTEAARSRTPEKYTGMEIRMPEDILNIPMKKSRATRKVDVTLPTENADESLSTRIKAVARTRRKKNAEPMEPQGSLNTEMFPLENANEMVNGGRMKAVPRTRRNKIAEATKLPEFLKTEILHLMENAVEEMSTRTKAVAGKRWNKNAEATELRGLLTAEILCPMENADEAGSTRTKAVARTRRNKKAEATAPKEPGALLNTEFMFPLENVCAPLSTRINDVAKTRRNKNVEATAPQGLLTTEILYPMENEDESVSKRKKPVARKRRNKNAETSEPRGLLTTEILYPLENEDESGSTRKKAVAKTRRNKKAEANDLKDSGVSGMSELISTLESADEPSTKRVKAVAKKRRNKNTEAIEPKEPGASGKAEPILPLENADEPFSTRLKAVARKRKSKKAEATDPTDPTKLAVSTKFEPTLPLENADEPFSTRIKSVAGKRKSKKAEAIDLKDQRVSVKTERTLWLEDADEAVSTRTKAVAKRRSKKNAEATDPQGFLTTEILCPLDEPVEFWRPHTKAVAKKRKGKNAEPTETEGFLTTEILCPLDNPVEFWRPHTKAVPKKRRDKNELLTTEILYSLEGADETYPMEKPNEPKKRRKKNAEANDLKDPGVSVKKEPLDNADGSLSTRLKAAARKRRDNKDKATEETGQTDKVLALPAITFPDSSPIKKPRKIKKLELTSGELETGNGDFKDIKLPKRPRAIRRFKTLGDIEPEPIDADAPEMPMLPQVIRFRSPPIRKRHVGFPIFRPSTPESSIRSLSLDSADTRSTEIPPEHLFERAFRRLTGVSPPQVERRPSLNGCMVGVQRPMRMFPAVSSFTEPGNSSDISSQLDPFNVLPTRTLHDFLTQDFPNITRMEVRTQQRAQAQQLRMADDFGSMLRLED
ncbi:hypothetical protein KR093_010214 [Drosophila rubida]|uniref:Uncharacterized protein n=1 Tax=Drosophila rubida TaxID=30044 RepID=A0AAD4PH93_9MUSC|nr:hypothetical protein KR093_010214 [Drosophila rubida]